MFLFRFGRGAGFMGACVCCGVLLCVCADAWGPWGLGREGHLWPVPLPPAILVTQARGVRSPQVAVSPLSQL